MGELRRSTVLPVAMLVASLAVLALGGFVQFDDVAESGSERWIMPLGAVAAVLAVVALRVACRHTASRRTFGAALAVIDGALVVLTFTLEGFRFIWHGTEGELFLFEVALGLVALWMLTPTFEVGRSDPMRDGRSPAPQVTTQVSPWVRVSAYATGLVLAICLAFMMGAAHFEATQCSDPGFDGECDLAGLEGLAWSVLTLIVVSSGIVVAEVLRARRVSARSRPDS
ncbi:hypothetical protein [Nocardioides sp. Root140]|uniref:hypothetical protein n=1 Tax=Nocardioides sp. Root140 TaxID=1736460 RepID=UPI000701E4D9|nr:hypothetical protein [Nocardioides sp. Root140]KQY51577.1 hypothetical protein ASD30_19600 [Nocardioides sp. Root140]